jgi:pimeloyl-ACP methyl ester carboxylesterase
MRNCRAPSATAAPALQKIGEGPGVLLIHGFGGPLAARAVLEDLGAFRGLILMDSFLGAVPEAYMEPFGVALAFRAGLGR